MFNIVSRDIRSQTRRNIKLMREKCQGLDLIQSSQKEIKMKLQNVNTDTPTEDQWRVQFLEKLLELRQESMYTEHPTEYTTQLIESLCCN